jgi:hypothetical protein
MMAIYCIHGCSCLKRKPWKLVVVAVDDGYLLMVVPIEASSSNLKLFFMKILNGKPWKLVVVAVDDGYLLMVASI